MSKQMLVIVGVLAATFFSGIAIGFFLASDPSRSSLIAKGAGSSSASSFFSDSAAQDREQNNALLSARIRELEKERVEQKKVQDDALVTAGRIAFFKKYHDQLRLNALNGDTQVSPEMAEVLGLSRQEQQAVEQNLEATSNALKNFATANDFVAKQDENGFTIQTPVDPQGKALKDALATSLSADIGDDRAAFLMSYLDDSSSAPLGGFAQAKKDLVISWANQDGKLLYTIKNQYYDPKGNGNSAGWYTTPTLPAEYPKYLAPDSAP